MLQSQKLTILTIFLLQIATSLNNRFEARFLADKNDCKQNLAIPFNLEMRQATIIFTRTLGNVTMYFSRDQANSRPVCRVELSGNSQITIYSKDNNQICRIKKDTGAGTSYGYEIILDSAANAINTNLNNDIYCKDSSLDVSGVRFLTIVADNGICGFDYMLLEQAPQPLALMSTKTVH
jgi:hypothetical protein